MSPRFRRFTVGLSVAVAFAFASGAQAQATRTWVSGVGDDANPCSRTAPCLTFAGAQPKTAAGGEISVLDPGDFGPVTITKTLTIDGDGQLATIVASGGNGITINAGASDVVVLRNLVLNGLAGTCDEGLDGIQFNTGGTLLVENVRVNGFPDSGININASAAGKVVISNASVNGGDRGVRITTSAGRLDVTLDTVVVSRAVTGVEALAGYTTVNRSTLTANSSYGVRVVGGVVAVESGLFAGNGVAVQSESGATLRLSNTSLYLNGTGFGCGAGQLLTTGDNRKGGNAGGPAACHPTGSVTVQ